MNRPPFKTREYILAVRDKHCGLRVVDGGLYFWVVREKRRLPGRVNIGDRTWRMNRRLKGREVISEAQKGLEQELPHLNVHQNHFMKNTLLGHPQCFIHWFWGGAWESASLTSSQLVLMPLVWGPHFENPWWRQRGRGRKCERSFIHPLSHQTGITHLLCIRPCAGCWGYGGGWERLLSGQGEKDVKQRDIRGLWLEAVVSAMKDKNMVIQKRITEWGSHLFCWNGHGICGGSAG